MWRWGTRPHPHSGWATGTDGRTLPRALDLSVPSPKVHLSAGLKRSSSVAPLGLSPLGALPSLFDAAPLTPLPSRGHPVALLLSPLSPGPSSVCPAQLTPLAALHAFHPSSPQPLSPRGGLFPEVSQMGVFLFFFFFSMYFWLHWSLLLCVTFLF